MAEAFEHHCTGPMGSEFYRIAVPPELVPALAERIDWNVMGRGVMIDAEDGIIAWRNSSGAHATCADAADKTVKMAARLLGSRARPMRDLRWKRPEDPKNTGLEADASFYVWRNAELWLAALEEDRAAADAFEAATAVAGTPFSATGRVAVRAAGLEPLARLARS